jgi:hypothetical protein
VSFNLSRFYTCENRVATGAEDSVQARPVFWLVGRNALSLHNMDLAALAERLGRAVDRREEIIFAYLFGSRAMGRTHRRSDVDVALFVEPRTLDDWSRPRRGVMSPRSAGRSSRHWGWTM